MEREAREAAEGRDVLVLLADRLAEAVDLDVACLLGEILREHRATLVGVKGLQERRGEASRGSEARPRRYVGHAGELEVLLDPDQLESLPNDRMLDVVDAVDELQLRVLQEDRAHEAVMDHDVDVSIDRRRDHEPFVITVVGRKIRAASTQDRKSTRL